MLNVPSQVFTGDMQIKIPQDLEAIYLSSLDLYITPACPLSSPEKPLILL